MSGGISYTGHPINILHNEFIDYLRGIKCLLEMLNCWALRRRHTPIAFAELAKPLFKHCTKNNGGSKIVFRFEEFFGMIEEVAKHFRTYQFINTSKSTFGQGTFNRS